MGKIEVRLGGGWMKNGRGYRRDMYQVWDVEEDEHGDVIGSLTRESKMKL